MKLKKFNPQCGLQGDDFTRDRRTVKILYRLSGQRTIKDYIYTFPMDLLRDIGAKELAQRIYWVFKQKLTR